MRRALSRVLSGSAAGQGVLLLSMPLLTRLYSASDFAVLAFVTACGTVLGGLSTLSLERAISLPKDRSVALGLMRATLLTILVSTTCFLLGSWYGRHRIAQLFNIEALISLWWVAPASSAAIALHSVMSAWLVREEAYAALGRRNASQGLCQALWGVIWGAAGTGPVGLATSLGIGRLAGIVGSGRLPPVWSRTRRSWTAVKTYRQFPLIFVWSRLANQVGLQAPILLIAGLYGPIVAGLYALTTRIISAPSAVIVDAVSQYFEGTFSGQLRGSGRDLAALVTSTARRMTAVAVLPALLVVCIGPQLFSAVFGAEWRQAGIYAQAVAIVAFFQVVVTPVSRSLVLLGRQGEQLTWDVTRAVFSIMSIVVPASLDLPPVVAISALCSVHVLWYTAAFFLCLRAARGADRRAAVGAAGESG